MAKHLFSAQAGMVVALTVLGTQTSLAQQQPQASPDTVIQIAPVSVTVLRTPLEMREVPYSVSVATEREISLGKPGISVEEALRVIPGVQVENRYNYALGERVSIRGFGARAQFGVRGVRVLVDGIPATLPDGQSSMTHVDVKSLGRVEVIRGPAASLYGNTAGGVIQMEMLPPPATPIAQEINFVGGSNGLLRMNSGTSGSSGAASYQLNLGRLTYDGYRPNSDATNYYVSGRFGYDTTNDRFRVIVYGGDSDAMSPGSLTQQQQDSARFQTLPLFVNQKTGKTVRESMVGGSWLRNAGFGAIEASAYRGTRDLVNPIAPTIVEFDRVGWGARALVRSNPIGSLGLQAAIGAEYDQQTDDRINYTNTAGERGAVTLDQIDGVRNRGFFGQVTLRPLDRVTLLAGLRHDWFEFSADDELISESNPDDSGVRTMDALSPSAGITFAVTEDFHVYGNVGSTFETPTTTELANRPEGAGGINPDLDPQTALSYEIGSRAQFGQRVALQLAVFRADVENSLVPFAIQGRTFFRNAAKSTHQGVEIGATIVPVTGVSVQTAYSYTDAKFEDYIDRFNNDFSGNEIPGVAPHRLETVINFSPRSRAWYAAIENRYVGEYAVNDANSAHSPSYNITEIRGGLESLRLGTVTFSPFVGVSNVFDTEYNAAVTPNDFNQRFFETGPGRAFFFGGSVSVSR